MPKTTKTVFINLFLLIVFSGFSFFSTQPRPIYGQGGADPEELGPWEIGKETVTIDSPATGDNIDTDIYYPAANGQVNPEGVPYPIVLLVHGFMHNKEGMQQNANHLTSWGFIVVAPSMGFDIPPNPDKQELNLKRILDYLEGEASQPGSVLSFADLEKIGYAGHSMGGQAGLTITSSDSRIKVLVGLDAVIGGEGLGMEAIYWDPREKGHLITVPTLLLEAPPQTCNSNQNMGLRLYDYFASEVKSRIEIINGSHCDFMDASEFPNSLCYTLCGGEYDEVRIMLARKYLTAWMGYFLNSETGFYPYLFGEEALKDQENGLTTIEFQPPPAPATPTPTPIPTPPTSPSPTSSVCLPGDVDNSGTINSDDLNFALGHYLEPPSGCLDQNLDAKINSFDFGQVLVSLLTGS